MRDVTLEGLAGETARLRKENDELRTRLARLEGSVGSPVPGGAGAEPVTRRAMLRRAGAAAAAGAGLALATTAVTARPARADSGTMMYGADNHAGNAGTSLDATVDAPALRVENAGTGTALIAIISNDGNSVPALQGVHQGGGDGVYGSAEAGPDVAAVRGEGFAGSDGVVGEAAAGDAIDGVAVRGIAKGFNYAVKGEIDKPNNGRPAIWGVAGAGEAVLGESTAGAGVLGKASTTGSGVVGRALGTGDGVVADATGSGRGVFAQADTGIAVLGDIQNGQSGASAVQGSTKGRGAGVSGSSGKGRGGVFSGKAAQLRLKPSGQPTHPSAGLAGDLFLDASSRLWLCTVTGNPATWRRVQLA